MRTALADDTNQPIDLRRKAFQRILDQPSGPDKAYAVLGLRAIQQKKCDEAKKRLDRAVSVREKQIARALLGANQRVLRMHQRYRVEGVERPVPPP